MAAAAPWGAFTDDELWALPFGKTITPSWMVWSDGHCPSCAQGVPMYDWQAEALEMPWKLRCPHCRELFPKNDFGASYHSGPSEQGSFEPALADRSLLFNADHPAPTDPLHQFGVADGEGYAEGDKRWRYIGAYLIYGQWQQAVLGYSALELYRDGASASGWLRIVDSADARLACDSFEAASRYSPSGEDDVELLLARACAYHAVYDADRYDETGDGKQAGELAEKFYKRVLAAAPTARMRRSPQRWLQAGRSAVRNRR